MDNYYTHYQICLRPMKHGIINNILLKYHVRKFILSRKSDIIVNVENYVFDKLKLDKLLLLLDDKSYCFVNSHRFPRYNMPHTYYDIIKKQFIDIPKPKNTDNFITYLKHVPSLENICIKNWFIPLEKYDILSSSI